MVPEQTAAQAKPLVLPTLVFGTVEVHRLQRELESLEDAIRQQSIRDGQASSLPRVSRLLDAVAMENHVALSQVQGRETIAHFLQTMSETAPVIHVSFSTDPSSAVLAKLVAWFRVHVHPHTLIQVGLQPNLAAGCVVRTTNKIFDLSLRNHFANNKGLLIDMMRSGA